MSSYEISLFDILKKKNNMLGSRLEDIRKMIEDHNIDGIFQEDSSMFVSTAILTVENLTKIYGREINIGSRKLGRKVVGAQDVTFDIKKGEIFGFLGPNGAGKTTAIRSILGYLSIKSGTIKIFDQDYLTSILQEYQSCGRVTIRFLEVCN